MCVCNFAVHPDGRLACVEKMGELREAGASPVCADRGLRGYFGWVSSCAAVQRYGEQPTLIASHRVARATWVRGLVVVVTGVLNFLEELLVWFRHPKQIPHAATLSRGMRLERGALGRGGGAGPAHSAPER